MPHQWLVFIATAGLGAAVAKRKAAASARGLEQAGLAWDGRGVGVIVGNG